jgi:hypothetical protein
MFVIHASYTESFNSVAAAIFKKQTNADLKNNIDLISTFLWVFMFGISTKYYQVVGIIERQYDYIHALELQLEKFYKNTPVFSREGKFYLNKYPIFSKWMWFLYTVAFPLLMLACIGFKGYTEIALAGAFNAKIYLNIFLGLSTCVTTLLYMARIHVKKKKKG